MKEDDFIEKYFSRREILNSEIFYPYEEKLKIKVFVPLTHVEKVAAYMSKAGAGVIGNYTNCSFRTEGVGTFLPSKKAKPFAGKKNILSYENEIKLEMECSAHEINKIIDAMLAEHPYEEAAYEIYSFRKRGKKNIGKILNFKKKQGYENFFNKINPKLEKKIINIKGNFKRAAVTNNSRGRKFIDSADYLKCDCFIILNPNFEIIKINENV